MRKLPGSSLQAKEGQARGLKPGRNEDVPQAAP